MELRHLRYFVAVAEELNFSRAAERVHIAQPPLSRQIRNLELELDTRLFHRTKQKVSMTEAGEALLRRARVILKSVEKAELEAQRVGRGEMGHIVVSYMSAAMLGRFPVVLQDFREKYPEVDIDLVQMTSDEQLHAIAAGEIDAGFASIRDTPAELELNGAFLRIENIWNEELLVALKPTHALAGKLEVSLSELADQPFVSLQRKPTNGYFDQLLDRCREAGFTPNITQEAVELPAVLAFVAAGSGVAIVPSCACAAWSGLLTFVRLERRPVIGVTLVRRTDNRSPVLSTFRTCVLETMKAVDFPVFVPTSINETDL